MEWLRELPEQNVIETSLRGMALLGCPVLNKGTAFTVEERAALGLAGVLPPMQADIEAQLQRTYANYSAQPSDIDRYVYLRALQDRNEVLFYRLVREHLVEMMPIIYTPVVGTGCIEFSHIYQSPRGLYIAYPQRDCIEAILDNRPYRDVDIIVVSDGERILGLGDQGANGMGIPIGKLSLYTACGGINPARTLPILLDAGTNNPQALADPLYVGWRHERIRGRDYDDFVEAFVRAVQRKLPNVLLQWEDFAHDQARQILERYRNQLCTFNDDIQGTAAVTLAAILAALQRTGGKLQDQRVVMLGAGSAGLGIADEIVAALTSEGVPELAARACCWVLDSRGLLHAGRSDLTPPKSRWVRQSDDLAGWQADATGGFNLLEVVRRVRPTILIGTSGQPGAFTEAVAREMAAGASSPIILPLSNPTRLAEGCPADLLAWTEGRALIATGSPFDPVACQGRTIPVGQCNNCYIFPGVGLGVLVSGARRVTEDMMLAASRTLAGLSSHSTAAAEILLPLATICDVSRAIALVVARQAQVDGVAPSLSPDEISARIARTWWDPFYRTIRPLSG